MGLAHGSEMHERYQMYKTIYSNCTYVDGNLELVFLDGHEPYDLSFLQEIREITGYVLIVANYIEYVPLTNLRIIRGRNLYEHDGKYYSLYIALNYKKHSQHIGLKELRFTSLREILAGSVFFFNNNQLCYEDTVNWKDILTGEGAEVVYKYDENYNRRACDQCHESCLFSDERHCWGAGPEYCQELTRISCSPQCDGRCFGPLPNQCCHSECAGGCTGPTKSECWACKNFENDGMCENFCPPEFVYSPQEYRQVPNPRAKYAYGSLCVDKCPSHLIADKGACVQDCGIGRIAGKQGKCVDCDGPCPKTCHIKADSDSDFIHSKNVGQLMGCTIVQGSIKIFDTSFLGDRYNKIDPMKMSQLSALETVQEVTDFVQIQANSNQFRSLSFLKNLRIIHGRKLDRGRASLQIFKTSLETLGFESLQEVRHGSIYIANNSRLCYANSIKWEKLRSRPEQKVIIEYNRDAGDCAQDNEVCNSECTDDGCWGPLEDQCISCRHFRLGKRCLRTCESLPGVYTSGPTECQRCHSECLGNCTGPGADNCSRCKNARDGPYCIPNCPMSKYKDENGICAACHANCEGGCTGPRNTVGPGGCKSCGLVVFGLDRQTVTKCLPVDVECDEGFYRQMLPRHHFPPDLAGKQGCLMCHPECETCNGYGLSFCTSCRHFYQEDKCVPECTSDYYFVPGKSKCQHCDAQCLSCNGGTASDCVVCKLYKVYFNFDNRENDPRFNCTEKCPDFALHKITIDINGETETVCVADDSLARSRSHLIIGVVCGVVTFVALVVFGVAMLCHQRARAEATKIKLTAQMTGIDEAEPLKPTDVKPNMSMLRLVKESELRCGYMIGSGAFGMVYKGLWIPEGENVKIPVAIKVLQKGSSSRTEELLEEAHIMASVIHPSCIRILCVCLTAQMMLITQLMPLGCLLDYVRKNRSQIGSSMLLNWCTQIAKGMSYLESRGIVHCDLAARNVLVQSPRVVKITDFGLARMLDCGHDKYYAEGRKMPIKWLALESILYRIFTHKSDVWSFGVTVWELLTFGQRPYENIHVRDIPTMLEKGERLHQPPICTIDVYMLMIKCWMLDVDGRPSFRELAEEFSKMARDPGRYLSIPGDRFLRLPSNERGEDNHEVNGDTRQRQLFTNSTSPVEKTKLTEPVRIRVEDANSAGDQAQQYTNSECQNRYSGLEQATSFRNQQLQLTKDHHNSFRYSSDPCNLLLDPDCIEPMGESTPTAPEPAVNAPKMSMYEDDYMQPKLFEVPSKYIELTDSLQRPEHSDEGRLARQASLQRHQLQPNCIVNPEYFESCSPTHNTASKLHSSVTPALLQLHISESPRVTEPSRFHRLDSIDYTEMKCSPTEAQHDYYNEFSCLGSSPATVDHLVKESPI